MRVLATSEVLQIIDIPRSKLYYLEQKGYVSPRTKVVGEKTYRYYSLHDVEKIGMIWSYLKRGMRYRIAYEMATEALKIPQRFNNRTPRGRA